MHRVVSCALGLVFAEVRFGRWGLRVEEIGQLDVMHLPLSLLIDVKVWVVLLS